MSYATLPPPLPVMKPDVLVIVPIVDGYADTTIVHLPAAATRFGGDHRTYQLADLKWAPRSWPARCGVVGDVYNHGGVLEGAPVCGACRVIK